jgi:hypothetical protein
MNNETLVSQEINTKITSKPARKKASIENQEARQRYIYSRQDAKDPVANLIDELLAKCNKKDYGASLDFSSLVAYSLKMIKDGDIIEIQNSSLSDEDKANEELRKFNAKNGTSYTLFEFVLHGLGKKVKKGLGQ